MQFMFECILFMKKNGETRFQLDWVQLCHNPLRCCFWSYCGCGCCLCSGCCNPTWYRWIDSTYLHSGYQDSLVLVLGTWDHLANETNVSGTFLQPTKVP